MPDGPTMDHHLAILERIARTPFDTWTRRDCAVASAAILEYVAIVRLARLPLPETLREAVGCGHE